MRQRTSLKEFKAFGKKGMIDSKGSGHGRWGWKHVIWLSNFSN